MYAKDFIGRGLDIGDEVIYLEHRRDYSALVRGVIAGFTPTKVDIRKYSDDGKRIGKDQRAPRHVVKVRWSGD